MAKDVAQALTALQAQGGLDLQSSIAVLREAVGDGKASTPDGYLVVCNDANEADPRFSIRRPDGGWL
jgi:hypothetical protein